MDSFWLHFSFTFSRPTGLRRSCLICALSVRPKRKPAFGVTHLHHSTYVSIEYHPPDISCTPSHNCKVAADHDNNKSAKYPSWVSTCQIKYAAHWLCQRIVLTLVMFFSKRKRTKKIYERLSRTIKLLMIFLAHVFVSYREVRQNNFSTKVNSISRKIRERYYERYRN